MKPTVFQKNELILFGSRCFSIGILTAVFISVSINYSFGFFVQKPNKVTAWYVNDTTCSPFKALTIEEETAWIDACLTMWRIASKK